jgi:hypothetical protein
MPATSFGPDRYKWREVTGEPGAALFVRHDYTILGHDLAAGTLDMVVRWRGDGGHCPIHRHMSTTTVLVLEGEQHLWDVYPDGARGPHRVRRAGDYALTVGDPHPHLERGGPEGGLVFFGNHSRDGLLYDVYDEAGKLVLNVTMELLVSDFAANT